MSTTNDKKRTRNLMAERGIKYTEALRAVQDKEPAEPEPLHLFGQDVPPRGNLFIGGHAGSGATITAYAVVEQALRQGWAVTFVSYKEWLPDYLAEQTVVYQEGMFGVRDDDWRRQIDYVAHIVTTMEPGTRQRPALLVIDNYAEFAGQLPPEATEAIRTMLVAQPYTMVAIRSQRFASPDVPSEVRSNLLNRIFMNTMSWADEQTVFPGYEKAMPPRPILGDGLLSVDGQQPQKFHVDFDPRWSMFKPKGDLA